MHERLPDVVPGTRSVQFGYKSGLQALSGFFDEHACFPFLEGLGLDPRVQITAGTGQTTATLEAQIDGIQREGFTARSRVNLAAAYVQAALIAPPSPDRDRLLALFDRPALHTTVNWGEPFALQLISQRTSRPTKSKG